MHFIYSSLCKEACDTYLPIRREWKGMFVTSGSVLQTREGRLMYAGVTRDEKNQVVNKACFSDDLGKTWNVSLNSPMNSGSNEAKVVELNDGTIVMSIRQIYNLKFSYSYDKGLTWNGTHAMGSLPNPDCDADIIRYTSTIDGYEKNRLLISDPFQGWGRANVSIVISYDEGKTWPTKRQLSQESSGYSAVTIDHDGDIHVHYEKTMSGQGYHMVVDSFSFERASYGKDKLEHPVHLNGCVCDEQCINKCKTGVYVANLKVFDSYVSSYYHYPKHMEYTFVSKVPDYELNVSIPGLVKYEVTNLNPNKPTISMTGESDHLIDFTLKNVKVKAFSNIIYGSTIDLEWSSIDINGTVTRIDNYDGYMMLIISPPKSGRSTSLLNIYLVKNQDFEIHKNSDSLDSSIKIVITENSKVSIKGYWSEEEGKRVTISNPNSASNAVVNIDQPDNVFAYEGSKPSVSNVTKFPSIALHNCWWRFIHGSCYCYHNSSSKEAEES